MLFPDRLHRFFGALFMLCNHQTLIYHSLQAALAIRVPPPGVTWNDPPFSGDPDGIPFHGCLFIINRTPWYSGYQTTTDMTVIWQFAPEFLQPRDWRVAFGRPPRWFTAGADGRSHSSFPVRDSRPTLPHAFVRPRTVEVPAELRQHPICQGPWPMRLSSTKGGLGASSAGNPQGEMPPGCVSAVFETRNGRRSTSPAVRSAGTFRRADPVGPTDTRPGFAAVTCNARDVPTYTSLLLHSALMCKVISAYAMSVFDLYLQDNMRGVAPPHAVWSCPPRIPSPPSPRCCNLSMRLAGRFPTRRPGSFSARWAVELL